MIIRIPALMPVDLTVYERRRLSICLRDALVELIPDATPEWSNKDELEFGYTEEQEREWFERALPLAVSRALARFYEWQDRVNRAGMDDLAGDEYVRAYLGGRRRPADDPVTERLKRIYRRAGLL
jgi:hypothetical protein